MHTFTRLWTIPSMPESIKKMIRDEDKIEREINAWLQSIFLHVFKQIRAEKSEYINCPRD